MTHMDKVAIIAQHMADEAANTTHENALVDVDRWEESEIDGYIIRHDLPEDYCDLDYGDREEYINLPTSWD